MGLFKGKKEEKIVENSISYQDFVTLKARVTGIELEIEALRNKVLRKIQNRPDDTNPTTPTIKPGAYYPFKTG